MALYDENGALIEGTEGNTVKVESRYSYIGDGDGFSYGIGIVFADGEYKTVSCGKGAWWTHSVDLKGSIVDGDVAAYNEYLAAQSEIRRIEKFNLDAYNLERGRYAIVLNGNSKRKRKNAGRSGRIFWFGSNQFGESVGIEEDNGERFFVAAYQVQVVPEPEID